MNAMLEMASTSTEHSIRFLAEATIRENGPDKAARELMMILAIQCPTNGTGALRLMNALSYLYQTGR